jgi:Dolichyl-phosphate-mannose-protein mannosyltransferase
MYNSLEYHSTPRLLWWLFLGSAIGFGGYYFYIGSSAVFGFADEGYLYYLGWSVSDGRFPYRDFELGSYPPGLFLYYALFFKILGSSIETGRIATTILMIVNVCLTYLLVRKISSHRLAIIAALAIGLVPGPWHKTYISTLYLASLYLAVQIHQRNSVREFVFMGIVMALAVQTRLDAAVCSVVILFFALWGKTLSRPLLNNIGFLLLAFILTLLPLLVYLGTAGLIDEFVMQLYHYGNLVAERTSTVYRLPAPSPRQLLQDGLFSFPALYYSSFLILFALGTFLLLRAPLSLENRTGQWRIALLLFIWLLLSTPQYAYERPDVPHLYQKGFAFIVCIFFLLGQNGLREISHKKIALLLKVTLILFFLLFMSYGLTSRSGGSLAWRDNQATSVTLSTGVTFKIHPESALKKVAIELDQLIDKTDNFAAIPYLPGLNFVFQTHTPGRKIHYFPNGIRNNQEDYNAASDISQANFILLQPNLKLSPSPGAAIPCYAPVLSEAINVNFQSVGEHGPFYLLQQRTSPLITLAKVLSECPENL